MNTVLTILVVFSLAFNLCSGASQYFHEFLDPLVDAWPLLGYNVRNGQQLENSTTEHQMRSNTGGPCNTGGGVSFRSSLDTCGGHGQCTNGICYCDSGYIGTNCTYHQKQQLVAFLLEFFIGSYTGAGSFYLGYTGQGVGKILLTWVSCVMICVAGIAGGICSAAACGGICGKNAGAVCGGILWGTLMAVTLTVFIAALIAAGIWSLVDWALIAANELNDANGYPLESW